MGWGLGAGGEQAPRLCGSALSGIRRPLTERDGLSAISPLELVDLSSRPSAATTYRSPYYRLVLASSSFPAVSPPNRLPQKLYRLQGAAPVVVDLDGGAFACVRAPFS